MAFCGLAIAQEVKKKPETVPESVRNRFSSILQWTIKSKENVCITGPAGTGKSELLRRIHQSAKEKRNIAVTTLTGQAAEQLRQKMTIDAQTIHKWHGTPIETILSTDILIIDDFSMLNEKFFESISSMCQRKRDNYEEPFGGIQLIIAGDPFLLPPIDGRPCFQSIIWKKCNFRIYKLTYPLRFGDVNSGTKNRKWFDMLKRIRTGSATPADVEVINENWGFHASIDDLSRGYLRNQLQLYREHRTSSFPMVLFGHKSRVRSHNFAQLAYLNTAEIVLNAKDSILERGACSVDEIKNKLSNEIDVKITVKVGAPIVVTRNIGEIPNGTSGIFAGKVGESVIIEVKKKNFIERLNIGKYLFEINLVKNGVKTFAQRRQYPISLAYAMTVHKAQGSEFKQIVIVANDLWEHGHFYTALSRGKSPDGVVIVNGTSISNLTSTLNKYNQFGAVFLRDN